MIKLFVGEDKNLSKESAVYKINQVQLLIDRYKELFKNNELNNHNRELLIKAISSIGFSTIVDNEIVVKE
jgi:hypothetical protein